VRRAFLSDFFDTTDNAGVGSDTLTGAKFVEHFLGFITCGFVAASAPHHHYDKSHYEEQRQNHHRVEPCVCKKF